MNDEQREANDAVEPKRRSRLLLLLLLLITIPVGVGVGLLFKGSDEPPIVEPPPPPPIVEVPPPPPELPPPPPEAPPPAPPPSPPKGGNGKKVVVEKTPAGGTMAIGGVTGDASLLKQIERGIRGRVGSMVVPMTKATYSVTLNVEASSKRDNATVRCSASVAANPKKNIIASLKSRADVAGENTPTPELEDAATQACANSLGNDLKSWIKAHPTPPPI